MESDAIVDALVRMANWQQAHEVQDAMRFEKIFGELNTIRTNHLHHIQEATAATDVKVTQAIADNWWLKKALMGVYGCFGALFIALLLYALTK